MITELSRLRWSVSRAFPQGERLHLAKNLFALAAVQLSNAGIPLLVYPMVLQVVGVETFAKIVFAEAVVLVATTVVRYSFDFDGVASIAGLDVRQDATKIEDALNEIFWCRLLLAGSCALFLIVGVAVIDQSWLPLFLWWLFVPFSIAFQPLWLYQGMENNVPFALVSAIGRLSAIGLILATVHGPADYLRVPASIGVTSLVSSVVAMLWAMRTYGLRFRGVSIRRVWRTLTFGKELFLGNASVLLYRETNVILLKTMGVSPVGIASYSLADKIVKGVGALMRPLGQLFLPRVALIANRFRAANRTALREILLLTLPQLVCLAGVITVALPTYLAIRRALILPDRFAHLDRIEGLVAILIGSVFFGATNFMVGLAGLNQLNERQYFFRAVLAAGIFSIVLCLCLAPFIGETAGAVSLLLSEAILTGLFLTRYFRHA